MREAINTKNEINEYIFEAKTRRGKNIRNGKFFNSKKKQEEKTTEDDGTFTKMQGNTSKEDAKTNEEDSKTTEKDENGQSGTIRYSYVFLSY